MFDDYKSILLIGLLVALLGVPSGPALAQHMRQMESMAASQHSAAQVVNIVRDPADVPPPIGNRPAETVKVDLTAEEVVGQLDPASGTTYRYWTFNGKVPGPMIRVRQGDTIEVTLRNSATSHMVHSVDFHAAIGPGGGAALSQVVPGQQKTFTFQATTPGLFVYHCGTPMIADHIANGMYGLILVEPPGGMTRVDHEYYVMQAEIYTTAAKGKAGLQSFSEANLMKEAPEYFVFNGAVDALTKQYPMHAETGQTVRIFFGDAGPNATSSFHVVGEIFTRDYELGSLSSPPLQGVQTANVPPGGAAILELKAAMPGQFNFMDHAMARMAKGLVATLYVRGKETAELMHAGPANAANTLTGQLPEAENPADISDAGTLPTPAAQPNASSAVAQETSMQANHAAESTPHKVATSPAANQPKPTMAELTGCFGFAGRTPSLQLFHSTKSYKLEARPLLLTDSPLIFAQNVGTLVQVSGHFNQDGQNQSFLVDRMEQLAPSCNTTQSLAQLRKAAQQQVREVSVANAVAGSAVVVGMGDMSFTPANITINAGETVEWKNTSTVVHNVVDDAAQAISAADVQLPGHVKPFGSGYLQPGQSYRRTFTIPGVYRYVCTLHETGGMKGTIVVRGGRSTDLASAQTPSRP